VEEGRIARRVTFCNSIKIFSPKETHRHSLLAFRQDDSPGWSPAASLVAAELYAASPGDIWVSCLFPHTVQAKPPNTFEESAESIP